MSRDHQLDETWTEVRVADLRVHVSQALTALAGTLPKAAALVDTRQRGLGFATYEAKQIRDEQIRKERRDRADAYAWLRAHQLHWNLLHDLPKATGETPAPGNVNAWSQLAEVELVLVDLIRSTERAFLTAGVCALYRLRENPTAVDLVEHLRRLSWHINNTRMLARILSQIEWCTDELDRLIDGNDKTVLDGPCPHCGRRTLVVTFTDGVIRCDRDPNTGQYEPCTCPDSYCNCHQDPHHRHEWHRDKGTTATGWWALSDRLNLSKQITNKEPQA